MPRVVSWTDPETWSGFFYELAIEAGHIDEVDLSSGLHAMWAAARVEGCVASTQLPFETQPTSPLTVPPRHGMSAWHGWVTLPSGARSPCTGLCIRQPDDIAWIDLALPTGALGMLDARVRSQSSHPSSLAWRRPIDDWLASIGREVYAAMPFRGALLGEERSGLPIPRLDDPDAGRGGAALVPRDGVLIYVPARA